MFLYWGYSYKYITKLILLAVVLLLCLSGAAYPQSQFAKNKFVPKKGKVLLFIGQDINNIEEYIQSTGMIPAGFTMYTSIQKMDGIYSPVDYGGGVQYFQHFVEYYPNTIIHIGLWIVDALDEIVKGAYDTNIIKFSRWVKEIKRPVYLRIGYEFDGPHNHYKPEKYIKAYRYIVDKLKKEGIDNIAYVWHSYASIGSLSAMEWYPGDEYVDWFGLSFFNPLSQKRYTETIVRFAREHNKQIMLAEASPFVVGTGFGQRSWNNWFKHCFRFMAENDVKALCYINCDWDAVPMFSKEKWGDARIQVNRTVKEQWLNEIGKEKYLRSSEDLFDIIGY